MTGYFLYVHIHRISCWFWIRERLCSEVLIPLVMLLTTTWLHSSLQTVLFKTTPAASAAAAAHCQLVKSSKSRSVECSLCWRTVPTNHCRRGIPKQKQSLQFMSCWPLMNVLHVGIQLQDLLSDNRQTRMQMTPLLHYVISSQRAGMHLTKVQVCYFHTYKNMRHMRYKRQWQYL